MDEERVEEIVTKFLINTCRLRPQFSAPAAQAAATYAAIAAVHPVDDPGAHLIPLTTGSVAEFYIEPMLPHVGDVDVMYHRSTELAIRQGQSPPTQLPAEFSNNVKVYEIVVDSDFPGYVYLQLRYLLTECNDDSKYNAVEYDRNQRMWYSSSSDYLNFGSFDIVVRRGPAVTNASFLQDCFHMTTCSVCVVCRGRHKPLIGQHDTETTAGQTQQLLTVLSITDVMWLVWHIVSVDNIIGWASISGECHSHEQKLYC